MLLNADEMYPIIEAYRLCWISGRFGGHKTSLAFYLAKHWLDHGYRLITNAASVWSDDLDSTLLNEQNKLHAVLILDEGGLDFKQSKQIEMIASYARKMDMLYILPSYSEPTRSARVVTIQSVWTLQSIGIPLVVYKWNVHLAEQRTHGFFMWLLPSEIYGIYDTLDPGQECSEIIAWVIARKEEFLKRYGRERKYNLPEVESGGGSAVDFDSFVAASESLAGALEDMPAIPKSIRIRKSVF